MGNLFNPVAVTGLKYTGSGSIESLEISSTVEQTTLSNFQASTIIDGKMVSYGGFIYFMDTNDSKLYRIPPNIGIQDSSELVANVALSDQALFGPGIVSVPVTEAYHGLYIFSYADGEYTVQKYAYANVTDPSTLPVTGSSAFASGSLTGITESNNYYWANSASGSFLRFLSEGSAATFYSLNLDSPSSGWVAGDSLGSLTNVIDANFANGYNYVANYAGSDSDKTYQVQVIEDGDTTVELNFPPASLSSSITISEMTPNCLCSLGNSVYGLFTVQSVGGGDLDVPFVQLGGATATDFQFGLEWLIDLLGGTSQIFTMAHGIGILTANRLFLEFNPETMFLFSSPGDSLTFNAPVRIPPYDPARPGTLMVTATIGETNSSLYYAYFLNPLTGDLSFWAATAPQGPYTLASITENATGGTAPATGVILNFSSDDGGGLVIGVIEMDPGA